LNDGSGESGCVKFKVGCIARYFKVLEVGRKTLAAKVNISMI